MPRIDRSPRPATTPPAAIARLLVLLCVLASASAAGGGTDEAVAIEERRLHYPLDADRVTELRRQLDRRGPRNRFGHPASGLTRHTITVEYAIRQTAAGCALEGLRVRTLIEIHLPRWQPKREPSATLLAQWRDLEAALTDHELGHRDNGVWASHELHRRLQALAPTPDCRALEREALRIRRRVLAELQAREDAFEASSDFGRTHARPHIEAETRRIRETRAEEERTRAHRLLNGF